MRCFARTIALFCAVLLALGSVIGSASSAIAATGCSSSVMNIVAHQDDDLLFQNPTLLGNIASGACVRTVYLTAGDAGANATYWQGRESGEEAAYAQMAGVANTWTTSDAAISGHPIRVRTLAAKSTISLAFLRMPDGNIDGSGFSSTGFESLQKLYTGAISTIRTLDAAPSYSLAALRSALLALMTNYQPTMLNTLDYSGTYGDGDHSDHHTVGYLVQAAQLLYTTAHSLTGYQGYNVNLKASNLAPIDATAKANAFYAYGSFDPKSCNSQWACASRPEGGWLLRQYILATSTTVPAQQATGPDLALTATAAASSQNTATGQTAAKAIDGVIDGYPGDYSKEWATISGGSGSFLTLTWPNAVTLASVILFDRPNTNDQITGATLTFSDGTTIAVPPLNNDGSATTVTFPARSTTSLKFTITSVSTTTGNIGLAELQAYGTTSTPPPTPPPTPPVIATNVALTATAAASSQNTATGQTAAKAIDGVIDGYPGDYSKEWATISGGSGSFLTLTWPNAVTLASVILFDRPNTNDQITGATLTFSDGTTIAVPPLNNDGSATTVTFPARSTTSLKFTITSVSTTTGNIGLAELQAFTPVQSASALLGPLRPAKQPTPGN